MRSPNKRSRSKSNRPRTLGNIVNRVFDSSGPEGKVRGTPQQIIEKYQVLARDAQLSNDRVAAENFQQHAEHYTRLLAQAQREMQAEQEARRQSHDDRARHNTQQNDDRGNDNRSHDNRSHDNRGNDNRSHDNRGQDNRGQNQPAQPRRDTQRKPAEADLTGAADSGAAPASDPAAQGAFDVQGDEASADQGTLVETPEDKAASKESQAESPAPAAEDAPAKPVRTRKPRAPRATAAKAQASEKQSEADASAQPAAPASPKPRRYTRKSTTTQDAAPASTPQSAAE